ncbi:MAG: PAS domain S-box protein [Acidobacteriia bacterium]|nr:PAS domain S-box protein [Terriglobia bacterium]
MPVLGANQQRRTATKRYLTFMRYGGAALAVWVALSLWSLSSVLHRHPFALFLAAVLLTARFLGFGPALFSSVLSAACLDLFVLVPRFSFALSGADLESLGVFLAISVFAGSMARQKSRAELRAERTTREMAAIVEYSDDAIFSKSPDGTVTSWNRGAERLYGFSAQEAVGISVYQLAPNERREEVQRIIQVVNRGEHVEPYQTERMRKDGTCFPVVLTVSPLRNAKGKIVGASVITRDISVQRQSEEAVRRSEKLATAGRLAASIAHEINNPLEAVLNLLYLARHDSSNAHQYLTMAEQEVGRIARLAQQTLGFVRETGSPGSMDPAVIMDEILQLYSRKLEDRSIRVTRRYRNSGQISGYSGELRQLLANLLVNAVDAMSDGGSLQVRVAGSRRWSDGREGIRITVADNGSGIARENLRRIFEPFYTTKKDAGTGLGLWVSRGIVQKHGGSIRARSRSEGTQTGTVFTVFMPHGHDLSQVARDETFCFVGNDLRGTKGH